MEVCISSSDRAAVTAALFADGRVACPGVAGVGQRNSRFPDTRSVFAATQAAYRFLNNPRVTLRALAKPLVEAARTEVATACDRWALVVHDWSQLMYPSHERQARSRRTQQSWWPGRV